MVKKKTSLSDLALFGGAPAFSDVLHVGRPNFGDRQTFLERVDTILSSRRFTNDGPFVHQFEDKISELTGARHIVATCNATTALQVLARALELSGAIVMPAFTFIGTAHAFKWLGLEPVFCDIDERTHGVDPASLEQAIGARCSALVAVHTWGIPCDVPRLEEIARRRNLPLLFDAAHAMGCSDASRPVGSSGTAEVLSFHATKIVSSFEGGAIATNDPDLAYRLRRFRDFGFVGYDRVGSVGTNAKLSEIHAAAGLTNLEALPRMVEENRRCFRRYREALEHTQGVSVLDVGMRGQSNHQYVVAEIGSDATVSRDLLVRALHAEGIWARRYFYPGCHRSAPYYSQNQTAALPVTDRVARRVLALPTGPSMDDESIDGVAAIVTFILQRADEFNARAADLPPAERE